MRKSAKWMDLAFFMLKNDKTCTKTAIADKRIQK